MTDVSAPPPGPATQPAPQAPPLAPRSNSMIVFSHSSLVYWWVIWAYSFFCAAVTFGLGEKVTILDRTAVIYAEGWLSVSFVLLTSAVLLFTNLELRNISGYVVSIAFIGGFGFLMYGQHWNLMYATFEGSALLLSGTVYIAFGAVFLVVWLISTLIVDRATFFRIRPDQIVVENLITGDTLAYNTRLANHRLARVDFMSDFVFGLGWLGLGTRDIIFEVNDQGQPRRITIKRAWRGRSKYKSIVGIIERSAGL